MYYHILSGLKYTFCFETPGIYTHMYKKAFTLKPLGVGKKDLYFRIHHERCNSVSYISSSG